MFNCKGENNRCKFNVKTKPKRSDSWKKIGGGEGGGLMEQLEIRAKTNGNGANHKLQGFKLWNRE